MSRSRSRKSPAEIARLNARYSIANERNRARSERRDKEKAEIESRSAKRRADRESALAKMRAKAQRQRPTESRQERSPSVFSRRPTPAAPKPTPTPRPAAKRPAPPTKKAPPKVQPPAARRQPAPITEIPRPTVKRPSPVLPKKQPAPAKKAPPKFQLPARPSKPEARRLPVPVKLPAPPAKKAPPRAERRPFNEQPPMRPRVGRAPTPRPDKPASHYGSHKEAIEKGLVTQSNFVDTDGDGIDDRKQPGPGQPSFNGKRPGRPDSRMMERIKAKEKAKEIKKNPIFAKPRPRPTRPERPAGTTRPAVGGNGPQPTPVQNPAPKPTPVQNPAPKPTPVQNPAPIKPPSPTPTATQPIPSDPKPLPVQTPTTTTAGPKPVSSTKPEEITATVPEQVTQTVPEQVTQTVPSEADVTFGVNDSFDTETNQQNNAAQDQTFNNVDIDNSGAGAHIANYYGVSINANNSGNSSNGYGPGLNNMQLAAAYNALNTNNWAQSQSQFNGYGRAAGAIQQAEDTLNVVDRVSNIYNNLGLAQGYWGAKQTAHQAAYIGDWFNSGYNMGF